MKNLFYALGIGFMLTACSSNDELAPEQKGETGGNANYVSISIVTANEDATRAATDPSHGNSNNYDNGTATERAVKTMRLYFFDLYGNCVYQKNYDEAAIQKAKDENKLTITEESGMGSNPAVSTIATIEVELSANKDYHSVVALLNPATTSTGEVPNFATLPALKSSNTDYGKLAQENNQFTMANSVYYPTDRSTDVIPADLNPVVEVPIYSSNIYTHEDPEVGVGKKYATLDDLKADKAVNIFVERVCSKVTVTNSHDFSAHFVDEDGTTNKIKVMGDDGKEKEIEVLVDFKGMDLTVMAPTSKVIKQMQTSKDFGFCQHVTGFNWNNPANRRTHWEEAGAETSTLYKRTAWKDVKTQTTLTRYINPNTQDATKHENDDCDLTTKLIVCAQLKFAEDGVEKALDLVRYSGGFWLPSKLISAAGVRVVENLGNIDLSKLSDKEKALANAAIANITEKTLADNKAIYLQKLEDSDHDYLAELVFKAKDQYDILDGIEGNYTDIEKANVSTTVRDNINATLHDMTNREIQYWKNGMTYFYVPIRHEGFPGLRGLGFGEEGKEYLNGVVRNHSYAIEIEGVWGLGTPVVDPEEPIDPERPSDAPASYMTAKIHVLKWRTVSNKSTLH